MNFFDEFAAGSFDNEPVGEKERHTFAKAFARSSKKAETHTQVSTTDKTDVTFVRNKRMYFSYQWMSKLV